MITKRDLSKRTGWYYVNKSGNSFPVSGWKLHIFGNTVDDSITIANTLEPILKQYNLIMKVATILNIEISVSIESSLNYGKIATVYLSSSVFKEQKLKTIVKSIKDALSCARYDKKGIIIGDRSINDTVHYRYELSEPVDPNVGIDTFEKYVSLYQPNRKEYNIPNNPDIYHLIE